MRKIAVILFGLLFAFPGSSGQKLRKVQDPYRAEYFSCQGKIDGRFHNHAHEQYGYSGFRIVADLNFDGLEDVILSRSDRNDGTGCGNAACDVTIFLKQSDGKYLGVGFGLHPEAAALKKVKEGVGQLVTYWRSGADEGLLNYFTVTEESVALTRRQTLHCSSSDKDERLYQSWFYENQALKSEYAHCQDGQLQWNGSYQ
jgi:hypothetical protein